MTTSAPQHDIAVAGADPGPDCPRTEDYLPWQDEQLRVDPYPFYARALREAPVSIDWDGAYVLTKYEDLMHYGRLPSVVIEPSGPKPERGRFSATWLSAATSPTTRG
ncbi:hypothetical protein BN970_05721 [Mycolicibacterium conceptionense]|uniref:Cytochrome P450 n=1 Tax=Mycolicibacterium conceptionense TaxID=451644 RepID=A0A0U1DX86_9MYCO|nr:hypothetical protein BN970_05721 [Mycolicibacterium conceptionense]